LQFIQTQFGCNFLKIRAKLLLKLTRLLYNSAMINKNDFSTAAAAIKNGGVIAFATDTVWGLSADATNENALKKIYEIKKRPKTEPLIVLFESAAQIKNYIKNLNPDIVKRLEMGLEATTVIIPIETSSPLYTDFTRDSSLAIRIPRDADVLALISKCSVPLASTSANITGEPTLKTYEEVEETFGERGVFILRGSADENQKPSQILRFENDKFITIRA
ncbi:MAG: L-threonylcarbamoyladenylate synthase, partial [Christensenellaceae bacterium]|nr:L-threonylcarbamoyladenylate synthase [Christensenellaceae bacterium]